MKSRVGRSGGGPLGCYWFLTFDQAAELHSLAEACQASLDSSEYDLAPIDSLHLTLDRIAVSGERTGGQFDSVERAARRACREVSPFDVVVGPVVDLRGAVGFMVNPVEQVHQLREKLRVATLSVLPNAPVKTAASDPHVTIAYPSSDTRGVTAGRTGDRIASPVDRVNVTISEVVMVFLERNPHSYSWRVAARIPLTG